MKIREDIKIFCERLRKIRIYLKLNQSEVANKTNLTQHQVSTIENSKGGSFVVLYQLLNFYSQYVYIDNLFKDKFEIIANKGDSVKSAVNTIVIEKLLLLREDLDNTIDYFKE